MGNVRSGQSVGPVISFDDARSHVSDDEFRRIQTAFTRFKKPLLNYDEFCFHVLGGAHVPDDQRRELFKYFTRGADSLSFENLFSALVGLCRIEHVQAAFIEEYPQFASWGLRPPLLSLRMNDSLISFYEVMSYVTHLAVNEVMELEKVFATISDRTVCKLSKEKWNESLSGCFPDVFANRLFRVFDENGDGQVDFRELVCGLSAMCRGPFPSRLNFLARLWDEDGDNQLNDVELRNIYEELNVPAEERTITKSSGEYAAMADFSTWAVNNEYAKSIYAMAFEAGHICLGLRPESPKVEYAVVASFEKRTASLSLAEWNIVATAWHREYEAAISHDKTPPPLDNSTIKGSKTDDGWSGKVACISVESASLKCDLSRTDYIKTPPTLWKAWLRWHGSAQSVDGQFTRKWLGEDISEDGKAGLELYPLDILLFGHDKKRGKDADGIYQTTPWACAQVSRCRRVEELLELCKSELRLNDAQSRLWLIVKDKESSEESNTLLDDGKRQLHYLGLRANKVNKFLLEVRESATGVWHEEVRASITNTQISALTAISARPGAVGLVNAGNFCYRNTAIQCLARVAPLTEFLLAKENLDKLDVMNNNRPMLTTVEYARLLREMWEAKKRNLVPNAFNDAVRSASAQWDDDEQHDCQEFISFLLDQLHQTFASTICDTSSEQKKSSVENGETQDEGDDEKADRAWRKYVEKEQSLITQLFAGQLRSCLVCRECGSSSSVFEAFTSLSLPIGFDNVELYHVIVVRRDGSIPRRYGYRLGRESTIGLIRSVVAQTASLEPNAITIQCLGARSSIPTNGDRGLADNIPLRNIPASSRLYALELPSAETTQQWRIAAHRKLQYNDDSYFLGSTGGCMVSRFGLPLVVPYEEGITGKQLYDDVMNQMKRFMDTSASAFANRAADPCEDLSTGYPFSLCVVDDMWEWCGQCPAMRFCRGCPIRADETKAYVPENCSIAVDWMPIALYLKYNHSQELACEDDPSVAEAWARHFAPSSLEHCLESFSCPETLDDRIDCTKCGHRTDREKIMSIWRLPKYLIIQLKRFEYLRTEQRMGKCKRNINFPLGDLDPSPFVDRPEGTRYTCIAIANHYGQMSSGHFIAYARDAAGNWLSLNDCSVRAASLENDANRVLDANRTLTRSSQCQPHIYIAMDDSSDMENSI